MKLHVSIILVLFCIATGCSHAQIKLKKESEELVFNHPPFTHCHASTIVEASPGNFMVAAFGGSGEGNKDVSIWLAKGNGKGKWNHPLEMADGMVDDTLRYPTWNPVLFKAKEGKLFLFYKVGPTPRKWWGMVRTSMDNGKDWSSPKKLPAGILGPIKDKPVQLPNGTILAPSSVEETGDNWKINIEKSTDLGKTWNVIEVDPNTNFDVIQPTILRHSSQNLQLLCRSQNNAIMQAFSEDGGNSWSPLTKTDLPNPNAGIDAVTLDNGWQVLVYNPTLKGPNGRAKLNVAISKDGKKWTDALVLENKDKGEFSYPAVIQDAEGKIHITYTYNRVNIKHVVLDIVNGGV